MITLVALICLGPLCQDVVVPTEDMLAGNVASPVPMQYTELMCRVHGFADAYDWLTEPESPQKQQYEGWRLASIKCVPGHYVSSKKA